MFKKCLSPPVTGPYDGLVAPVRGLGGVGGEVAREVPHLAAVRGQLLHQGLAAAGAGVERPLELQNREVRVRTVLYS